MNKNLSIGLRMKVYLIFVLVVNPLICFLLIYQQHNEATQVINYVYAYSISLITTTICIGGAAVGFKLLKINSPSLIQDLAMQTLLLPAGLATAYELMNAIFNATLNIKNETPFPTFFGQSLVFIITIISIGYLVERLFKITEAKKQQELKLRDLEIENLKFKIEQLEEQFKPHFIFNAFNNLANLIHTNPKIAEKYTLDLADFFRMLTTMLQKQTHTFESEINFNLKYIELEKVRLGSSITINTELRIPERWKTLLVPTSVFQPLIENAIKYSPLSINSASEINLRVFEDNDKLLLEIKNKISDENRLQGTSNGLSLVSKRLGLCLGESAISVKSELVKDYFLVRICFDDRFINKSKHLSENKI